MRLLLRCILLLSVSTFTAGLDFQQGPSTSGQSLFSRHSYVAEKAAKIAKRSLPAWLSAPANHRIRRRSIEQGGSCRALDGSDTKLEGNTHQVSYRERSGYSSPAWQWREPREDEAQVLSKCTKRPNQIFSVCSENLATKGLVFNWLWKKILLCYHASLSKGTAFWLFMQQPPPPSSNSHQSYIHAC